MGAINGYVIFDEQPQQFIVLSRPRVARAPKQSMMNDHQIGLGRYSQFNCGQTGVHSGGNFCNGTIVLDLQAIYCAIVIANVARAERFIAIGSNQFERS